MISFDGDDNFKIHLKRSIQFSLIGKIKGFFSPKTRIAKKKYIQIGCGFSLFKDFENLDFYSSSFSFWKKKRYIGHDFRFPLPFNNNSFQGAYSEHVMEHLYFDESKFLLKEIYRILKKRAVFRCTVPSLDFYIDYKKHKKNKKNKYFSRFETQCDAIRDLTCNYGHLNVWDKLTLKRELQSAGFKNVKVQSFLKGKNKNLLKDDIKKTHQTIYLEGVK